VTLYLLMALAASYLAFNALPDPAAATSYLALIPYNLIHGISLGSPVVLTPLSSLFIHGSPLHLVSNLLVLGLCGPAVERYYGPARYLGLFLFCGLVGGMAQVALDPGSHRPIIGASGAISGLLGAYVVRFPIARPVFGVPIVIPLVLWAVFQGTESGIFATTSDGMMHAEEGPVAYAAHFGGFLCGLLAAGLFY
jgi:membrane associated rhomboid family serine protease